MRLAAAFLVGACWLLLSANLGAVLNFFAGVAVCALVRSHA